MGTYSLLARLPAATDRRELRKKLFEMMIPHKYERRGDPDPPELEKYLAFVDQTEEIREDWETEIREMIIEADGSLHNFYDKRYFEDIDDINCKPVYPPGSQKTDVRVKDLFSTFDDYASDVATRNSETGKYGCWRNPHGRWDGYQIGLRYPKPVKFLPLINGSFSNIARFCSIKFDFAKMEKKKESDFEEFWQTYKELFETKILLQKRDWAFPAWARMFGFMEEKFHEEITDEERSSDDLLIFPSTWKEDWQFLFKRITYEDVLKTKECFGGRFAGWARIDADGWQDCGSTPEELIAFANGQVKWLSGGNRRDWLIWVQCHD